MIFSHRTGTITYEESYWDSRALNYNTINISTIETDNNNAQDLITSFKIFISNKFHFVSFRLLMENEIIQRVLINNGFFVVEKSYIVEGKSINIDKVRSVLNSCIIKTNHSVNDLNSIKNIAEHEFKYGRFFEDPFISNSVAKKRNLYWINDIIKSEKIKLISLTKKDLVIGFMAFQENESKIQLLFGGVKSSFAHLAYGFWGRFFEDYCGNKNIYATISCSNIPIVNLYAFMGFRFEKVLTGFHLHL